VFAAGGPHSDVNKGLLTKAAKSFLRLARNCAEEGFDDLHLLLNVSEASDFPAWLEDRSWYADWQCSLIRELAAISLIRMENGEPEPVSDAHLPLGDEAMTWQSVYRLGASLAADWAPAEAVAEGCSAIAEAWTALLGADDPLIESCVLTPERLIERVKEVGSLKNLGAQLELEPAETVAWLNGLISTVAEAHRATRLDGLVPDQTPEGAFRSSAELSRDTEIDDELNDVLETLDDPIRKRLVHEDIVGAEVIIKRVQPRDPLVSSAKDRLKKQALSTPDSAEFRTACLTMFQWLAVEGRWTTSRMRFPFTRWTATKPKP
jgi:hypothetical protein